MYGVLQYRCRSLPAGWQLGRDLLFGSLWVTRGSREICTCGRPARRVWFGQVGECASTPPRLPLLIGQFRVQRSPPIPASDDESDRHETSLVALWPVGNRFRTYSKIFCVNRIVYLVPYERSTVDLTRFSQLNALIYSPDIRKEQAKFPYRCRI